MLIQNHISYHYIGDFKGIGKLIWQRYKVSIKSEIIGIGIKGVISNIKKVGKKVKNFLQNAKLGNILGVEQNNNNDDNSEEYIYRESLDDQLYNRKRPQKDFYYKFRYYKEFKQDDAYYFDLIQKKLQNTGMNFIFTNLVKDKSKDLFVFTNFLLIILSNNFEIYSTIYYYIANVSWKNKAIYIQYNQIIDGGNSFQFSVESERLAQITCNIIIEETATNHDNFNDL